MDEKQLERLLARGRFRLRLNAGLRWSCGMVLLGASAAAVTVLVSRFNPGVAPWFMLLFGLLMLLVLSAGVLGYVRCRPAVREVAFRFDRAAALKEHLTTWEELRRRGWPQDPVARCFAQLQRAATFRAAEGLRPGRLLPVGLPAWSRGLWLVLLFLGCAVLMPEQRSVVGRMSGVAMDDEDQGGGSATFKPVAPGRLNNTFNRIDILSQSDRQKLEMSCGAEVPDAIKSEVLSEIEAKVGGLSGQDLTADVRVLLDKLRIQVRGKDGAGAKPGASTASGGSPDQAPSSVSPETGAHVLTTQQALALSRERFPDVAEALQRYYLGK